MDGTDVRGLREGREEGGKVGPGEGFEVDGADVVGDDEVATR